MIGLEIIEFGMMVRNDRVRTGLIDSERVELIRTDMIRLKRSRARNGSKPRKSCLKLFNSLTNYKFVYYFKLKSEIFKT